MDYTRPRGEMTTFQKRKFDRDMRIFKQYNNLKRLEVPKGDILDILCRQFRLNSRMQIYRIITEITEYLKNEQTNNFQQ